LKDDGKLIEYMKIERAMVIKMKRDDQKNKELGAMYHDSDDDE